MRKRPKQAVKAKKRWILSKTMQNRLAEGCFLIVLATAIFLLISLFTYNASDPAWSTSRGNESIQNSGGWIGAWLADILLSFFGLSAYIFPILLVFSSWVGLNNRKEQVFSRDWMLSSIGLLLFLISFCSLIGLYYKTNNAWPAGMGGVIGDISSQNLSHLFNHSGATLLLITTLFIGITLLTGFSWLKSITRVRQHSQGMIKKYVQGRFNSQQKRSLPPVVETSAKRIPTQAVKTNKSPKKMERIISNHTLSKGHLPPLSLLQDPIHKADEAFTSCSFETLSELVEKRLFDFGVDAKVKGIYPGPIITRFELDLAPGVKVSKIVGLAKDIARSLSTVSVRVVEVIPGKSYIGLEIPNEHREIVTLKEVLASDRYKEAPSLLSMALGRDISGAPIIVDLAKMPHLLVAGTTGSGKSVSLNTMLVSFLYKASPDEVKFILIDPKMLELSLYEGIPHLLTPVITDMKDAANALRWCVAEMDRRYRLMATCGVRNLASYNEKIKQSFETRTACAPQDERENQAAERPLPFVVVIIDELADMMMVVGKKVEDLITRIAQKARAAGIHLILATQRPSVDVITGLIKANIPTRIAFQVSSRIDSRTILDQQGAEQLLGNGDMLYLPPGAGIPIRVHGAFIADEEVHRVVACWRTYGEPQYINEVIQEIEDASAQDAMENDDPLFEEAVKVVLEARRASISLVQRRLRIGYNRAARIMEQMETKGLVSVMDHSGNREILTSGDS